MPLAPEVIESGSNVNLKTGLEMHAVQLYRMRENALGHDQRCDKIAEFHLSAASEKMTAIDPAEAFASKQMFTGDAVAQQLASLLAAINSGQQGTKSAGNTPPVTP